MGDGPIPAGRGIVPGQVAEVIVALDGKPGRRGSGYRVGPEAVLTAAHVIDGAVSVWVRFDADLPGEWVTEAISCWTDPRSDLAVLTIIPREVGPRVAVARFGRISDRAAVLAARAVGFPRFKLKNGDGAGVDDDQRWYRDSHQADGSVAVLSNRREGTLEVTVPRPERDPDPGVSPWEGMSGAAVWVGDRIVGVIAKHHRADGLGRLAAARLDLSLEGLDQGRRAELRRLLDLPEVLLDVVPTSMGERVTTAYQVQVRDIAPDNLFDRDAELNELVGFCAGDPPYAWWQAEPWAGKSALMSWFVLHPPAGIDVVSFFVTARLAGQSDSDACTDALIEQLATLIGESPASLLTAGARRGTMLRLLDDAANRSREAGRRLLLVIDGLDEDSGTATSSSIAKLLPRRPPPEVRVLVASRPHPPIPDDVAYDHPLRVIIPRQLDVSEHARGVERCARHELTQLLAGSQLQRDVLGLITVAGGALTLDDLAQLTERPLFEIEHLLGGLFGRSVGSRTGTSSTGFPDERVYLFTHETLRVVAEQQYDNNLAAYRDQLYAWADTWRHRGWPADTPHYLLRNYPRMLASSGNVRRLVVCATDQIRHDRTRSLTGGDALAVTEISAAQQLVLAQPEPDFTGLVLLAVQQEHLTYRNRNIPTNLPAVWAMLGHVARAEALANGIPNPNQRVWALTRVVETLAASSDDDRTTRLTNETEALTAHISQPNQRAWALAGLADAVATGGDHDRAEALTEQITDPYRRAEALARLAETVAACGDHDRAEALTAQITDPNQRAWALAGFPGLVAPGGDDDRADALIERITDTNHRAWALARIADAVANDSEHGRATRLADETDTLSAQNTGLNQRAQALGRLAKIAASGGDHRRAEVLITQITDPNQRAWGLAGLAEAAAACDHDRAARLATEAEALAAQITDPHLRAWGLARLTEAVAVCGDHDRAKSLAAQIADPNRQASALAELAEAAAACGDHDRAARLATEAEALAAQITDPYWRACALSQLVRRRWWRRGGWWGRVGGGVAGVARGVVGTNGDGARAARLAAEVEALAAQITDPYWRACALARLVGVVGGGARAARLATEVEALAAQITDPYWRACALARLVGVVGGGARAARLATEAEVLTAQVTDIELRAGALAQLAEATAIGGDHDRAARLATEAEALTAQITDPYQRTRALAGLAMTLVWEIENTSSVREHARRRSMVLIRVRCLLAEALVTGSWTQVVVSLARVDPLAVSALADELQVRWKLNSPTDPTRVL